MSFVLGKDAIVSVNSQDLSSFVTDYDITRTTDSIDTTTLGKNSHTKLGGLKDGTITLNGIMDGAGTTTPDVKIGDALGTVVAFSIDPGSSSAPYTGNVLIQSYKESAAVADVVRWTATLEITGDVA